MEKELAELRHAGAVSTEEEPPTKWFGMAESDCPDEHEPPAATISPVQEQDAPQEHALASPADGIPLSHPPVMLDVQ